MNSSQFDYSSVHLNHQFISFISNSTAHTIPIEDTELTEIEAHFDVYRDVRLLLSTRRNRGSPMRIAFRSAENIRASPFDPTKPTRVLVRFINKHLREILVVI